jgi:hypothetical protein
MGVGDMLNQTGYNHELVMRPKMVTIQLVIPIFGHAVGKIMAGARIADGKGIADE